MPDVGPTVYQILIVDDHPLVRCGFSALISQQADLRVCSEAASSEQAIEMFRQHQPDLVIVDISLGGASGLELIKQMKNERDATRVLVVSMHDESLFAERSLRAGALGYINKAGAPERIIEAIRQVLAGQVYVSQQTANRMLQRVAQSKDAPHVSPIHSLTDRELEVFSLIGHGLSTREIAARLDLSIKTIDSYREHLKAKLNLPHSSELMRHAVQWVLENG